MCAVMTEVDINPRIGADLKDGFKPVNAWVSNGIAWLDDIQNFYRERSTIEKEYAIKLSVLAKKFHEKKAKKIGSLSVGDTPSLTPGSLESASLTTWTTQLSTLERHAAEHDRYSAELVSQVADPLKTISIRYEEIRKSHAEYASKLEKERDTAFVALKRVKGQYDGACQEVESKRKRIDTSFDSSKPKAQIAYQQQLLDMHNVKNTYLISINVTNKQKNNHYHEYVPDLLDSLQDLAETRIKQLNSIWSHATKLEVDTLSRSVEHLQYLAGEIPRNDPRLDSMMFLRHNTGPWQEPRDAVFEPSPVWHDDDAMAVDDTAKIFLRNTLSKSKRQVVELKREVEQKRRDVDKVKLLRQNIREGKDKRDEVEVVRAIFSLQGELHEAERKRLTADIETATITSAVGDISLGANPHNLKSQTFKIPTNCDFCGDRIWGLSAKGFDCRDCGYTCHSKCELKVPADCPGEQSKDEKKKLKAERQASTNATVPQVNGSGPPAGVVEMPTLSRSNTMNSLSSGYAASAQRSVSGTGNRVLTDDSSPDQVPTSQPVVSKPSPGRRNRVVAPPPTQYVSELPSNGSSAEGTVRSTEQKGRMLYAYGATGDGELTVEEGTEIIITEPDDGSGWLTVRNRDTGASGLVPTSYVELALLPTPSLSDRPDSTYSDSSASVTGSMHTSGTGKKKGPAVAPKKGARKLHYVEALYDYEARSEVEWSMSEGERFVCVVRDSGDGWADVEKGGQVKSVPANYVRDI